MNDELHMAALTNDGHRVRELIAAGADVDLQDRAGFTPLHFAAQQYAVDAVRLLLEAGATVDVPNEHGNTALWTAVFNSKGRGEVIELLLRHGADPDRVNRHAGTPREAAELIGNYDVAQFFR
jgi:ankyrin repeat protein